MKRSICLAFAALACASTTFASDQFKDSSSAFLRAAATAPVNWMTWGEAAFARAKSEQKPIYVFTGYFTNELSRAMQKQSFENPQIAASLNRDFICVLVDRDERPDLAAQFQLYLQANKQLGGWPSNLWLTPELKPFDGAAYLPPSEEWGKEGIANFLKRIAGDWKDTRDAVHEKASDALSTLIAADELDSAPAFAAPAGQAAVAAGAASWMSGYDATHGGFGDAPRFAEPELLRFLLRTPGANRDAALATLRAIDRSALHDPLDGGFFRRSIDAAWQFPSFQKLLGDQARLALAYLDAARITGDATFAAAARSALDYGLSRLADANGAFIHAEDATPEEIAAGYGWTDAEITKHVGEKDAQKINSAWGVRAEGNVSAENDAGGKWKGKNILLYGAADQSALANAKAKLLALRDQRSRPLRDDHLLVGENGLFIAALAEAGNQLKEPRYIAAAKKAVTFLRSHGEDAKTGAVYRVANTTLPGGPDDYAGLALGIAAVNTAAPAEDLAKEAARLLDAELAGYLDAKSGHLYVQSASAPVVWVRAHAGEPGPGEGPSAETLTILAALQSGKPAAQIPASMLGALVAAVKDGSQPPRGDALLALAISLENTK